MVFMLQILALYSNSSKPHEKRNGVPQNQKVENNWLTLSVVRQRKGTKHGHCLKI